MSVDKNEDTIYQMINQYIAQTKTKADNPLFWWKANEHNFKCLASLAKKYLSVQASSAAVERMFSIAGHIFSNKRRRLAVKFYSDLVYFKLNENFMEELI